MATTKRWLEHLHAREEQRRRKMMMGKNPDEEEDALFNPNNVDLGAMLMSVSGFTLPSKEDIEQEFVSLDAVESDKDDIDENDEEQVDMDCVSGSFADLFDTIES